MPLTSIEKVILARDHEVAKWLKEGLNEIVTNKNGLKPDELKSHLGLETAFHLMWIQNQSLNGVPIQSGVVLMKALSILMDDPKAIYLRHNVSVLVRDVSTSGPTRTQFLVKPADLRCSSCSGSLLTFKSYPGFCCPSCDKVVTETDNLGLLPTDGATQKAKSDQNVDEVFKDEIASYESWDQ
ncbi:hypothetical protein EST38_g11713 [Candolleomyces aberdarensis]|uniref:Uncharacterized protein n=1 Tax=Candolleomyces aberdarensis TaxID=2316362 RepID=A0A4Q2D6V6_9AGAR|nr:hypothetical protein EST38_g11713 [Candolleomyces aberdarensis]